MAPISGLNSGGSDQSGMNSAARLSARRLACSSHFPEADVLPPLQMFKKGPCPSSQVCEGGKAPLFTGS